MFRIKNIIINSDKSYYYIEEINSNHKLCLLDNKELLFNNKKNNQIWKLINIKDNYYQIKNSNNNCYIKINEEKCLCENISFERATNFKLIKIFTEVKEKQNIKQNKILEKEPVDVLIKYIDLNDPNLRRNGIHQIEKDYDNEELKYSIRSILKNIPWIRKIFILMPNDKVRYFKDYNLIKEKIVYVKDKDLLGYDSSNCNAFLFRYWMMKKFGISDNVIVMDDDCFIGKKLNKSDFFYVKNGKVIPLIITSNFIKIDKLSVEQNYELFESRIKNSKEEQTDDIFNYSKYLTYLFILNLFKIKSNENIFIPKFTHNAIPVNLKDLKEIYDLAYHSKYKNATLDCLYRTFGYLQFQIFVLTYTFLKYHRKVKDINYKFIKLNNTLFSNYQYSLFCINKGPGNYSYLNFNKAKIVMEYLFPIPTIYEVLDFSSINISFNTVYALDEQLNFLENQYSKSIPKIYFYLIGTNIMLFFILLLIKINFRDKYYTLD